MTATPGNVEAITREIRACFNRLRALGDRLHEDIGITAAMRAVLETLYEDGTETVPRIARKKSVTRQHIQVLVNNLVDAGLVATRANPADKRSPLVALTARGRGTFERMREREKAVLGEMSRALVACDGEAALAMLMALRIFLDDRLEGAKAQA